MVQHSHPPTPPRKEKRKIINEGGNSTSQGISLLHTHLSSIVCQDEHVDGHSTDDEGNGHGPFAAQEGLHQPGGQQDSRNATSLHQEGVPVNVLWWNPLQEAGTFSVNDILHTVFRETLS